MKKAKQEKRAPKTETKAKKPVNYHINAFGEIVRDVKTEEINTFLDENVPDKKFTET